MCTFSVPKEEKHNNNKTLFCVYLFRPQGGKTQQQQNPVLCVPFPSPRRISGAAHVAVKRDTGDTRCGSTEPKTQIQHNNYNNKDNSQIDILNKNNGNRDNDNNKQQNVMRQRVWLSEGAHQYARAMRNFDNFGHRLFYLDHLNDHHDAAQYKGAEKIIMQMHRCHSVFWLGKHPVYSGCCHLVSGVVYNLGSSRPLFWLGKHPVCPFSSFCFYQDRCNYRIGLFVRFYLDWV